MDVWLTPQQIAAMRLAGMPTHEVSIRRMCKKNLLAYRSKERGKGIEIALSSLPLEAQRDYYARFAARMTEEHTHESQPHEARLAGDVRAGAGGVDRAHGQRPAWIAGAVGAVLVADCGAAGGAGAAAEVFEPSRGGGRGDAVGESASSARGARGAGAVTAPATPDVAPSVVLPAPGGEPIRVGLPSPALSSTALAATGAGGLTGGGGLPATPKVAVATPDVAPDDLSDAILVGRLVGARRPTEADFERVRRAREVMIALRPLLDLPERHRGRRALAERIGEALGCGWQHVYRLAEKAREGGVIALARMGMRADRGQARVVVSAPWLVWAEDAARATGLDVPQLAERMVQAVRAAWVGGAPSARQAWLTATAAVGRALHEMGAPSEIVAGLLNLPCPRRFAEAEGQQFRVAGRARRDAKGVYDRNLTPVKRTAAGLLPGDLVCGDISPLDIPVARPDGSTAYARMISWHDVATNWLWIDLFLCEKGEGVRREHVAASFCRLCEQAPFGAPKRLYLDNGSEYKWEELLFAWAQLAELTGQRFRADEAALLPESGRVVRSIPFHPRGKRIEGQFGNLGRWLV